MSTRASIAGDVRFGESRWSAMPLLACYAARSHVLRARIRPLWWAGLRARLAVTVAAHFPDCHRAFAPCGIEGNGSSWSRLLRLAQASEVSAAERLRRQRQQAATSCITDWRSAESSWASNVAGFGLLL